MTIRCLISGLAIACLPLVGQMPEHCSAMRPLGHSIPEGQAWFGAGIWTAYKHGPPATLVQSLGLGNSMVGSGYSLEGGRSFGALNLAGKVLLFKDAEGASRGTIQQAHVWYRTKAGWQWSLEKEPLVWGYGLNGGYLLGEAAQPFPRMRVETPFLETSLFSVPLGSWKGEFLMGKLEPRRELAENIQDPSSRTRLVGSLGEPQGPMLSGFRAEARFGESTEFYVNWINLFGGTLNGVPMTSDYSFSEYLTAILGAKDSLAEGNNVPDDPSVTPSSSYKNKARSCSNSDVGVRIRLGFLESLVGARDARFYITRGSKAVNILFGAAWHRPWYCLSKDIQRDWSAILHFAPQRIWNQKYRYYAPSPEVPNDVVGFLLDWEKLRVGLEYLDTVNSRVQHPDMPPPNGHRSFVNSLYMTGFYYYGDPLGTALGGEARYGTLRVEWEPSSEWLIQTWIHSGERPYRDVYALWMLDHPGQAPNTNCFFGLQQVFQYRPNGKLTVRGGYSYQHQESVLNQFGVEGNGFRWFCDIGWRWQR